MNKWAIALILAGIAMAVVGMDTGTTNSSSAILTGTRLLDEMEVVLPNGTHDKAGSHLAGKVVGLYFAASWCPPSQRFTPKLKASPQTPSLHVTTCRDSSHPLQKFYETVKKAGKPFEVVYVSSDDSEKELTDFYTEEMGDWLYLPFGSPTIKWVHSADPPILALMSYSLSSRELRKKYGVKAYPTLLVINQDGQVIVEKARSEIQV